MRSSRIPSVFLSLLCAWLIACAALPADDEDQSGVQTGSKQPGVIGGNTQNNGDTPSNGNTASVAYSVVDPATTASGVAIRSRSNPSKCIQRAFASPSENDALTLANCANDVRQAFVHSRGYFCADGNYCIGFLGSINLISPQPGPLVMRSQSNVISYIEMSGAAVVVRNTSYGSHGYLIPQNDNTAIGTPIVANPNYGLSANANWDLTGVGPSASRGAILAVDGSRDACVVKVGAALKLAPCDPNQSAQRWSFPQGDLLAEGASPGFVVGGMNGNAPALVFSATASNSSSLNQGFCSTSQGFQYAGAGITITGSYYLSGDTPSGTLQLTKDKALHSVWMGGTTHIVYP